MSIYKGASIQTYNELAAFAKRRQNNNNTSSYSYTSVLSKNDNPLNVKNPSDARLFFEKQRMSRKVEDGLSYSHPKLTPLDELSNESGITNIHDVSEDSRDNGCCARCNNWCDEYEIRHNRPFNWHAKLVCFTLLFYSLYLTVTGKGILAILQGVLGLIFGVEGFHNSLNYNVRGIRNYLIFLIVYCVFGTAVSIINMNTIGFYCAAAITEESAANCNKITGLHELLHLLGVVIIVPIMWVVFLFYYRVVRRYHSRLEKARIKRVDVSTLFNRSLN